MPIFLKGRRPQYFDKENIKIPSKHGGKVMTGANIRTKDGKTGSRKVNINLTKCPGTVMTFGNTCGGERDIKKRFIMGKIANKYSDRIFLTDDNPRNENPSKIRKDIKKGINKKKIKEIANRKKAIHEAIKDLNTGDL